MPELPEVETTKLSLTPLLGKTVANVHQSDFRLREPMPNLVPLISTTFTQITRRAKYLLLQFQQQDHTQELLIHLGMSGSLEQYPQQEKRKHDHVIVDFGVCRLHYHDPRRFGMVLWAKDARRYLDRLGIEPLSHHFTGDYLHEIIHYNRTRPIKRPIKALLMEQNIVVGIGNIYAAESLFLAGIHPATPAHLLTPAALTQLVWHIKTTLRNSIAQGGSSLKDFSVGAKKTGYFQQTLAVYGRQGKACSACQQPLEYIKIAARSSVFCPHCQPLLSQPLPPPEK